MNKYISTIFLLLYFVTAGFSQDVENKANISEVRKNNYQVELGFRSLRNIIDNTASATILFKKKYNPGDLIDVSSIRFLRAYFTINVDIRFENDTIPKRLLTNPENTFIELGIGIEKQFQNRKFVHYIGCDFFTSYFNGTTHFSGAGFWPYLEIRHNRKTLNSGLIPFIGIKYYITDQLSLGIETGFSLSYYFMKFWDTHYRQEILNGQVIHSYEEFTPFNSHGIRFNYLGMRFITIGYSFK